MRSKILLRLTIAMTFVYSMLIGCSQNIMDTDLIGNENCQPPCWNGIWPGVSEQSIAVERLNELEENGNGHLILLPERIRWESRNGKTYFLTASNHLITSVKLDVESTTIEELLSLFGEPSYFLVDDIQKDAYSLLLLYPEEGLVFRTAANRSRLEIQPNMKILVASFLARAELSDFLLAFYGNRYDSVILEGIKEWKGYGEIPP